MVVQKKEGEKNYGNNSNVNYERRNGKSNG